MTSSPSSTTPSGHLTIPASVPGLGVKVAHPTLQRILLLSGVVSSIWYVATDVIGTRRYPGYSWLDQDFSELTAQGSPVRPLMIALNELPYNLLVLAFAAGIWASTGVSRRAARIAAGGLVGYAAFGFVAGTITPMATRETMASGEDTPRNALHVPLTIVMSLALITGMIAAASLLGKRFRNYTFATIAVLIAFGLLTSLQLPQMKGNNPTPLMGLAERVDIYATMVWMATLAIGLLRAHPASSTNHVADYQNQFRARSR
jgi:hypothetical protein